MDFTKVDQLLAEMYPQMEEDLCGMLRFASIKAEPLPNAPFGKEIADTLEYCLKMSERLGLSCGNVDGYMVYADLPGATAEQVGVLGHVDVVPANAADWTYPPFSAKVADGKIYARGTTDDKGPMVAALYGALALQKAGIPLTKTVRFLYGGDEESGFGCIKYYLTKHVPPSCGFSPDGKFPVVMAEKGIVRYQLTANWSAECCADSNLSKLVSVGSGQAVNIVPDIAEAVFDAAPGSALEDLSKLPDIEVEVGLGKVIVIAKGKAGHASRPDDGDNALAKLFAALATVDFAPAGAKQYLDTLARLFADSRYGETLGVADKDEHSVLTTVPSMMTLTETGGSLTCDMRFPVTRKMADLEQKVLAICAENGLELAKWDGSEPMFLGPDSSIVQSLLKAYRGYTGDNTEPFVMGGGTYARSVPNHAAFGPEYPLQEQLAHQADEYITQEQLLDIAKIYARAIYELAK